MSETHTHSAVADKGDHELHLKIAHLTGVLDQILHDHPDGMSEHSLLKKLQSPEWSILEPVNFRDPTKLYPVHFLVFHALYRLRNELVKTQNETLAISAPCIVVQPSTIHGTSLPDQEDALALYYLDLNNLHLSAKEIDGMLDDFWHSAYHPQPDQLADACDTLGIACPPADVGAANRQFRRLAMMHHPDRGGDSRSLQRINHAIAVIRTHFAVKRA